MDFVVVNDFDWVSMLFEGSIIVVGYVCVIVVVIGVGIVVYCVILVVVDVEMVVGV